MLGYIGIMEKKIETTTGNMLYRGYVGIMEKKIETSHVIAICTRFPIINSPVFRSVQHGGREHRAIFTTVVTVTSMTSNTIIISTTITSIMITITTTVL